MADIVIGWQTPKTNWKSADCLNNEDITRIESNIKYLLEELNKLPYNIPMQTHKGWDNTEIPNTADIKHICDNIKELADCYYSPPKYAQLSEITSKKSLTYEDINDLEECLLWLHNEYKVLGRNYNLYQALQNKQFTHAQLAAFTHDRLRKDWSIL